MLSAMSIPEVLNWSITSEQVHARRARFSLRWDQRDLAECFRSVAPQRKAAWKPSTGALAAQERTIVELRKALEKGRHRVHCGEWRRAWR